MSGSYDKTVRRWDSSTGHPIGLPMVGHENWVESVAISLDGSLIVSGSQDKTVRRWNATTGEPIGPPMQGHQRCREQRCDYCRWDTYHIGLDQTTRYEFGMRIPVFKLVLHWKGTTVR